MLSISSGRTIKPERCSIGSLNLDPRAFEINTENGHYIESKGLCRELAEQFDTLMSPENAWRPAMDNAKWKDFPLLMAYLFILLQGCSVLPEPYLVSE